MVVPLLGPFGGTRCRYPLSAPVLGTQGLLRAQYWDPFVGTRCQDVGILFRKANKLNSEIHIQDF